MGDNHFWLNIIKENIDHYLIPLYAFQNIHDSVMIA